MVLSHLMKNRKMRSGQAIVIITLSMIVLLAIVALGIDGSKFYTERRVAQNAADEASLAGVYLYQQHLFDTTPPNDQFIFSEISRVATLDQINTGTAGNLTAYWYNASGNPIAGTTFYSSCPPPAPAPASACYPPAGATAIRVRAVIPYDTFFGGFLGQTRVYAEAVATARLVLDTTPPTNTFPRNPLIGGGICNTVTDAIAFDYHEKNNDHFPEGFYVNGSLNTDTIGGNASSGAVQVKGVTGQHRTQLTPLGSDPLPPSFTPYTWLGNPPVNPEPYPYTFTINGTTYALDTSWFNPKQNGGAWGPATPNSPPNPPNISPLLKAYNALGYGPIIYVPGDTAIGQSGAETFISNWLVAHPGTSGIFYVDGSLTISGNNFSDGNWTLVVRDRFKLAGQRPTIGTAGPWAYNFSVFAGGDLGGPSGTAQDASPDPVGQAAGQTYYDYKRCASDETNAILEVDGNHTTFAGILFVPNGLSFFYGNNRVGGGPDVPGLITYSFRLGQQGNGTPANNWQFDFLPNLPALPKIVTQLMGNG